MDEFLARLAKLEPDLGGTARIDMTDIPDTEWRNCRRVLEAHGWALDTFEHEQRRQYWIVKRPGTPTISRHDPYFIKGPSIHELCGHTKARQAAEQAKHDIGVDPLSDTELNETRATHLKYYRKAVRYYGVAVICGLTLLVILITTWRHLGHPALLIPAVLLLLGTVIGGVLGHQALRERKTAVTAYTEAYERVVAAVMTRPD